MNLTQLRKRAKYWQDKLGLKHWAIKVVWAKSSELDDSENTKVYGLNTFDPNHMTCLIQVLHPKNAEATYNVEETLIHELLHHDAGLQEHQVLILVVPLLVHSQAVNHWSSPI